MPRVSKAVQPTWAQVISAHHLPLNAKASIHLGRHGLPLQENIHCKKITRPLLSISTCHLVLKRPSETPTCSAFADSLASPFQHSHLAKLLELFWESEALILPRTLKLGLRIKRTHSCRQPNETSAPPKEKSQLVSLAHRNPNRNIECYIDYLILSSLLLCHSLKNRGSQTAQPKVLR